MQVYEVALSFVLLGIVFAKFVVYFDWEKVFNYLQTRFTYDFALKIFILDKLTLLKHSMLHCYNIIT